MPTVFVENYRPNSKQHSGRGPPTASVSPFAAQQALREEWKSFSERYVKFMEVRQAMKAEMVAEYGWNSPQSNEAGEKLISFHTRIRVDWHDRLRERDLHPRMCEFLLNAEEKELLLRLIGSPAFRYKAGEDPEDVVVSPPMFLETGAASQRAKKPLQAAEPEQRNPNTLGQALPWNGSLMPPQPLTERLAGAVQAPPPPPPLPPRPPLPPPQVPLSPPKIPYHTKPTNPGPQGKIRVRRERYYDVVRPQMQFPNPPGKM
ncbi:hypothetical protein DENSPDRAFT_283733 [Dentipellis sp. KUC8613]|nr:hypothetical protein DENSPDRAFT_283733 [Dentipellis sp. KUC8613]